MKQVRIDFSKVTGKIKPMHAVNNGPVFSVRGNGTVDAFREAGIPYARNHDAAFYSSYGGEHTVDVMNIFRIFDADEADPSNYDFRLTDQYNEQIMMAGTNVFYRLGSKIEHQTVKYQTHPPKDFHKWARICEHIIRHMCYGWADGYHHNIEYWEIWNEPDCRNHDGSNPCWQGTKEQFWDLFEIAAKHLKKTFPDLKIGGPAFTGDACRMDEFVQFIEEMAVRHVPMDFFSYHGYKVNPQRYQETAAFFREVLDKNGYNDTELILNEWNYVRGWLDEDFRYSLDTIKNEKGAAFAAGSMLAAQKSPLDMFMYYDARPCGFNGLFETNTNRIQKPYYAFWQFNKLYQLHDEVESESDSDDIFVGAACQNEKAAAQIVYYSDEEIGDDIIKIYLKGVPKNSEICCTVTDSSLDNKTVLTVSCDSTEVVLTIPVRPYTMMLFELTTSEVVLQGKLVETADQ